MIDSALLKRIIEGALLAAGKPLTVDHLQGLFEDEGDERPRGEQIREALKQIASESEGRGFELVQVASGYRFQVRRELGPWVMRLWEERPQRYSRAMLETLALIAYRQPITRGEIEEIRGVAVSSGIMKTLLERDWVRVVGHRDVPGRPSMYATTRAFLDYFNLKNLEDLPTLAEIRDLESLMPGLDFGETEVPPLALAEEPAEDEHVSEPDALPVDGADDDNAQVSMPGLDFGEEAQPSSPEETTASEDESHV